ncbi:hypothetical protein DWG18_11625 [Lysobacter sp. TY2-98]|uniref:hypothetical protein n=1 Tax=Lysobacter sp. TY2-98 TaxID=2290922 RepID=UPI000E20A5AC|nr:hypothetical protein [Lysobacter sp. TY2-98]AXK72866.1 hypothetical protein DWG18_11625 [Lysobacter sp. TY2-98]
MSRPSRTRFLLAALLTVAGAAHARNWSGGRVDMTVIDRDDGRELPEYRYRSQDWVAGTPGHRYAVRLTNRSASRVLVMLSVDGVNAVTGQTASADQAGYVLEPYATTELTGWRKSLQHVAQFYFSDVGDSYAARTGRPRNVGVIGIAVFDEARPLPPPPAPPVYMPERREADAAASAQAAPKAGMRAQQAIGTGHGDAEYSPVSRTGFVRTSRSPAQVSEIRYDDVYALVKRGVIPYAEHYARGPQAFPGSGFVPDPPPGW